MNGFDFIMSSSFKREKYTLSCEYRNLFEIDPRYLFTFCTHLNKNFGFPFKDDDAVKLNHSFIMNGEILRTSWL